MAKTKVITGLEIGSSKIATIIAQIQVDEVSFSKQVNILGASSFESKGVKKGQIVNIEEVVDSTINSVEAAERMAGYNIDKAYVSLGGAHIFSQNSHGVVAVSQPEGEITEEDVDRVVEAASAVSLPSSREIVHIIPKEYIVDGEPNVRDPIGMTGVRLEVYTHLITASSAAVKNLKKALNEVGIEVLEFVYSGLASSEAVLTDTEKELGCVLVDIGGGTTSIAAFIDGSLSFSADIPVGANNVTNDLAIGLRVSLENAEKIKIALSNAKKKKSKELGVSDKIDLSSLGVKIERKISRKTLTDGIIRPRLNEIFTMVRLRLEKEGLSARVPSGAILTGGGADTVGALDSAKRMLSLPARIGNPRGVSGLIDDIINPAYATPVGLVKYASAREQIEGVGGKFKLPVKGIFGKLINFVKDILP